MPILAEKTYVKSEIMKIWQESQGIKEIKTERKRYHNKRSKTKYNLSIKPPEKHKRNGELFEGFTKKIDSGKLKFSEKESVSTSSLNSPRKQNYVLNSKFTGQFAESAEMPVLESHNHQSKKLQNHKNLMKVTSNRYKNL